MHFRVHVKGCSFAEPTYFGIGYFFQELNDFILQGFFSHWSEEEQVSASANTRGECCSQHFQPFETHCWPFYMLDFKSNDQMMNIWRWQKCITSLCAHCTMWLCTHAIPVIQLCARSMINDHYLKVKVPSFCVGVKRNSWSQKMHCWWWTSVNGWHTDHWKWDTAFTKTIEPRFCHRWGSDKTL